MLWEVVGNMLTKKDDFLASRLSSPQSGHGRVALDGSLRDAVHRHHAETIPDYVAPNSWANSQRKIYSEKKLNMKWYRNASLVGFRVTNNHTVLSHSLLGFCEWILIKNSCIQFASLNTDCVKSRSSGAFRDNIWVWQLREAEFETRVRGSYWSVAGDEVWSEICCGMEAFHDRKQTLYNIGVRIWKTRRTDEYSTHTSTCRDLETCTLQKHPPSCQPVYNPVEKNTVCVILEAEL